MPYTVPLWSVRLELDAKPVEHTRLALENALEPFGAAMSSFETDNGKGWLIEVFSETKPAPGDVAAALRPLGRYKPEVVRVPDKDWLAESRKGLPEFRAGPFFFYGSHFKGKAPRNLIGLEIDAGIAFGTGRHETTRGCLLAIARLAKTRKFKKPLDVGTGTGILAFGIARLCNVNVLAADNDAHAVRVARENAKVNKLTNQVRILRSDGYRAKAIRHGAPYDLVTANILANPLIQLAPGLARVLAKDGRAVLSGLLREQEKDVLAAHEAAGLTLDFRLRLGDWSVLVLRRPARRESVKRQ
ncbi:50S ribosomal protein L11 methyltransferase [Dongia deserti]|uniref:50S ribosomal protein L11 methyltransferase n=1 Tax=Dongia deserti TaxID=2268030 RepID=UPI0013C3EF42|nr:50S ribosomal protein L11 methyltransferase [Dongia deserti]